MTAFHPIGLTAQTEIVLTPEVPVLENDLRLECIVRTDEVLQASGTIELFLPNGTLFAAEEISSPESSVILDFVPLTAEEIGEYRCISTVESPEYPGVGLQQFQVLDFGMSKLDTIK